MLATLRSAIIAALTLPLGLAAGSAMVAAQSAGQQMPAYIQLQRPVVVNADLWSDRPEILAANYGFEGIIGIPGLTSAADLDRAIAAGAGVNLDWAALDPVPPLRNLTSGAGVIGTAGAGFGGSPLFGDAMPIEVSWPILPGSLAPDNIAITLNTGEVVAPQFAALNPNYDHNERHVIVVFGQFGNRLAPGQPGAVYPVDVAFVGGASPLMAVGPDGPVSIVGLRQSSSNPYVAGPALVGAKLNLFSPVGDFPPPALAGSFPNDAYSLYGEDAQYRLRLFTSGGFSPDGVSGFIPTDFSTFFRLHATDAAGNPVLIDEAGRDYDLGVGTLRVVGLAEVGAPVEGVADRAYYVEDHDNYFDIVLKGDEAAIRRLLTVEIPTAAEPGYSDIYNPGGPGRTPAAGTIYTRPALRQFFPIDLSLDAPRTVSHAAQDLTSYDLDDGLPVVFRLRDPAGPDRLTASSIEAAALVDAGLALAGVDYANETARPGVRDVNAYAALSGGDRIYTLDVAEQAALAADDAWQAEGRAFGAFDRAWPGASAVYRFFDGERGWHLFTADLGAGLQRPGATYQGIGWYSGAFAPALPAEVRFDRPDDVTLTDPIDSAAALVKEGAGTLTLGAASTFAGGTSVNAGRLQVNGSLAGGSLVVAAGGSLSGSGSLATPTTMSGRLAPGNSPGTLTFFAPVTMTPGSVLEVEVDGPAATAGAGGYDRVILLGGASSFTAAGTLEVRLRGITPPATNSFTPVLGQRFAGIVAAQGGILGSFANLAQPGAGLPPGSRMDLLYGTQAIDLVVTPARYGNLAAAGLSQTANQAAVGAALDGIRPVAGIRPTGAAADLFPALAPLSGASIGPALDSLSGQIHADSLDGAAAGQRFVQSLLAGRTATGGAPGIASGVTGAAAGWGEVLGGTARQRAVDGISGHDLRQRGVAVGIDGSLPAGPRLGVALGRLESRVSGDSGSADLTSTFASLYGTHVLGRLTLSGHLLGSVEDTDSSRAVRVGTFASDPRGSAGGWGLAGGAGIGQAFRLAAPLTLRPEAGVTLGRVHRRGFTETEGGAAALTVSAADRDSLRSRLGATLRYRDRTGPGVAWPAAAWDASLSLGWNHEFLDRAASSSNSLAGAGFTVRAAAPGRDTIDLGAGLGVALGGSTSLEGRYLLTAGSATTAHGGMLSLRLAW